MPKWLSAAALATAIFFIAASSAQAGFRHDRYAPIGMDGSEYPWITVNSDGGSVPDTISAPVRPGRYGYQVRLPGGVWVDCSTNCYDTLRNQTIDFWQGYGR